MRLKMAQTKITLFFSTRPTRELLEIRFSSPSTDGELTSVRGTFSGARGDASTFKWTPATQALSVILLRAAADGRDPTLQDVISRPLLFGRFGSLANALSRGIYKNARWILDGFGVDKDGRSTIRRVLKLGNSRLRRPGNLEIGVNYRYLNPKNIKVVIDGRVYEDPSLLRELAARIYEANEAPVERSRAEALLAA